MNIFLESEVLKNLCDAVYQFDAAWAFNLAHCALILTAIQYVEELKTMMGHAMAMWVDFESRLYAVTTV